MADAVPAWATEAYRWGKGVALAGTIIGGLAWADDRWSAWLDVQRTGAAEKAVQELKLAEHLKSIDDKLGEFHAQSLADGERLGHLESGQGNIVQALGALKASIDAKPMKMGEAR